MRARASSNRASRAAVFSTVGARAFGPAERSLLVRAPRRASCIQWSVGVATMQCSVTALYRAASRHMTSSVSSQPRRPCVVHGGSCGVGTKSTCFDSKCARCTSNARSLRWRAEADEAGARVRGRSAVRGVVSLPAAWRSRTSASARSKACAASQSFGLVLNLLAAGPGARVVRHRSPARVSGPCGVRLVRGRGCRSIAASVAVGQSGLGVAAIGSGAGDSGMRTRGLKQLTRPVSRETSHSEPVRSGRCADPATAPRVQLPFVFGLG
jgi:hypothetical protein